MTLSSLQSLTDDELRVKVAEACGWTSILPWSCPPDVFGISPIPRMIGPGKDIVGFDPLPNYPASLDACATFEAGLDPCEWSDYTRNLRAVIQSTCNSEVYYVRGCERAQLIADIWFYCASPRARCIAYLLTQQNS